MADTQTPRTSPGSAVVEDRRSRSLDPVAMGLGRPPRRRGRVLLYICTAWLALIVFGAIFADFLPLKGPALLIDVARMRPGFRREFLGTDVLGRSTLSRIVYGARASLMIGVGAVTVGLMIGGTIGIVSGYFKGRVDTAFSVLINSALAFPPLVLLLAVAAMVTPSMLTITLMLSVLAVPSYSRLSRANTLAFAEREFVTAARAMGASHRRILLREILPNVALPMLFFAFLAVGNLMVVEGALSFLGVGIPPPTPSWGRMMSDGRAYLASDPHLVFVPSIVLLVTIFSLNVIGDHLRRRFDTKDASL